MHFRDHNLTANGYQIYLLNPPFYYTTRMELIDGVFAFFVSIYHKQHPKIFRRQKIARIAYCFLI